jgi:hypothetical protein
MNLSSRISLITAASLLLTVLGAACNSSQSTSQTAQPSEAPAWAMQYKTDCTASSDASSCVGAYGLTVNSDQTYQVGPTPTGQVTQGKLSDEDFQALTQAATSLLNETTPPREETCNDFFGAGVDYTLSLTKRGVKADVLHKKGNTLCSDRLEADAAEAVHTEVMALADKYYPSPFPNPCLDAANELKALYPAVQKCNVDADCGYLDLNFEPIDPQTVQPVYADNCSVADNLPSANLSLVQAALSKLQDGLAKTQQACGENIIRDHCQGVQTFDSNAAAAVCSQGTCKVNPSLGF